MRERYWHFFFSAMYKSFYYKHFQQLLNGINWFITAFLSLTSLSCIATWGLWSKHKLVWTVFLCTAQVIQALFPKLPYNELLISTKFMISALDSLIMDIEHDWLYIDIHYAELSEDDILNLLYKHQSKYSALVNQFFAGAYLPTIGFCEARSQRDCENYFTVNYPTKEESHE